jgi:hypothetical protein
MKNRWSRGGSAHPPLSRSCPPRIGRTFVLRYAWLERFYRVEAPWLGIDTENNTIGLSSRNPGSLWLREGKWRLR